MASLMPCPFCGHPPRWEERPPSARGLACVNPDCGIEVRTRRTGTEEEVIAEWNRRADPQKMVARNVLRGHLRRMLQRARGNDVQSYIGIVTILRP
jgi:hypothetical protein